MDDSLRLFFLRNSPLTNENLFTRPSCGFKKGDFAECQSCFIPTKGDSALHCQAPKRQDICSWDVKKTMTCAMPLVGDFNRKDWENDIFLRWYEKTLLTFLSNFPYKPKHKAKNKRTSTYQIKTKAYKNKNTIYIYTQTIYYVEENVVCSSQLF